MASPITVTILSGFLGSGKTTLLNRMLAANDPKRIAVIENELGTLTVDDELLAQAEPGKLSTVTGRTCCETRYEFVELLYEVAKAGKRFDRLLVETTGVAHPGMVAHALLSDPQLKESFVIDGIITVVDAAHFEEHAGGDGHADEQVAYADALVVNKTDLVAPEALARLLARLKGINRDATVFTTVEANAPLDRLFSLGGFDMARVEAGVTGCHHADPQADRRTPEHQHEIETVAVEFPGALQMDLFQAWIEAFVTEYQTTLYRAKGIVALAAVSERLVFQGVHGRYRIALGRPWNGARPFTRMVFIGRNLDRAAIERGLAGCRDAGSPSAA